MRLAHYSTDVSDTEPTHPCPIPEPFASGVRHAVPENDTVRLVTKWDVATLALRIVAVGGALVVGLESYHLWYLGGPEGAWLAFWTNGAAVALGASVVAMWRRR